MSPPFPYTTLFRSCLDLRVQFLEPPNSLLAAHPVGDRQIHDDGREKFRQTFRGRHHGFDDPQRDGRQGGCSAAQGIGPANQGRIGRASCRGKEETWVYAVASEKLVSQ